MGFKSWMNSARRFFRRRQNKPPSAKDMSAIRAQLNDEPVLRRVPYEKWPGFRERKKMSALEFVKYVQTHYEMRPPIEFRAAWKEIYSARLEVLNDPTLSPRQKIAGMSGNDARAAEHAIEINDMDIFRVCVAHQILHVKKRIKDFS